MWRNILVPTDFSGAARQALQLAVRLAPPGCTVHVMHVITPTESDPYSPVRLRPEGQARRRLPEEVTDELLQQLVQDVATDQVVVARAWRRSSDVIGSILDYADTVEAELIVLGTHGRRGLQRFLLGSVAEAIVRRASVPVLTVREHPACRRPSGTSWCPRTFPTTPAWHSVRRPAGPPTSGPG
ncbi:UspA domain-containing protein [Rhodothermus marinus SG0.5JP17-172]|uniref:universal stress protein n=1 Tax=Rhodothermus marinus TaxID=29549 RepID=UPI000223D681|nr:universal stress protein [Rhodothermus marinus]AEN73775.1 UspA domain-containing protein [Rhodothermus marinus SG0.5JP17-172]